MQLGRWSSRHLNFAKVPIIIISCTIHDVAYCFSTTASSTTPHLHDASNHLDIIASNAPLLDVRAPIEFIKGSIPNARNIPLLNDKHRELVGTCYKEQGQNAAISLGNDLVKDKLKEDLVQSWKDYVYANPAGYLYCARGGLRSHIVQEWIQEATGVTYPLIVGGYKAMRSSLLLDLETSLDSLPIVLIGGRTCSGKTVVLKQMSRYVDLEGLANHRGSAFGAIAKEEQPAQQHFENSIIIECLKHRKLSSTLPVFMEDEGNRIGDRMLPISMHSRMANDFPLIIVETPLHERIDLCIQEYIQSPFQTFLNNVGASNQEEAHSQLRSTFLDSVGRINKGLEKRWGGTRNQGFNIIGDFEEAFDLFKKSNASNVSGFIKPIQLLLEDYYDPMYDYQMSKRNGEILFCGSIEEIVKWTGEHV